MLGLAVVESEWMCAWEEKGERSCEGVGRSHEVVQILAFRATVVRIGERE